MARKEENLKPNPRLQDPDYAAEIGRKGGVASGRARRKKANLKKAMEEALSFDVPDEQLKKYLESLGFEPSNANALVVSVLTQAINKGDYKAMETILQMTGQADSYRDKQEQKARIEKMKAETRKMEEEIDRKSGRKGQEEAGEQTQAIADLINTPASERTLEEYLGGDSDGGDKGEGD